MTVAHIHSTVPVCVPLCVCVRVCVKLQKVKHKENVCVKIFYIVFFPSLVTQTHTDTQNAGQPHEICQVQPGQTTNCSVYTARNYGLMLPQCIRKCKAGMQKHFQKVFMGFCKANFRLFSTFQKLVQHKVSCYILYII